MSGSALPRRTVGLPVLRNTLLLAAALTCL